MGRVFVSKKSVRKWMVRDDAGVHKKKTTKATKARQSMGELFGEDVLDKDAEELLMEIENGTFKPHGEGSDEPKMESTSTGLDEETIMYCLKNIATMGIPEMRKIAQKINPPLNVQRKHLRARLRAAFRREFLNLSKKTVAQQGNRNKTLDHYDYLVVVDFECTCVEKPIQYPHEIIEFPAVLVNLRTMSVEDCFQTYVRPRLNPILDDFCKKLTGITQAQVDCSPYFPEAYANFEDWMRKHNLGIDKRFAFVTDGPNDFHKFLQIQCLSDNMALPPSMMGFIDIKKIFEQHHGKFVSNAKKESTIKRMLDHYKLAFEGKAHSGLDDSINIARLAMKMMEQDNIELKINMQMLKKVGAFVVENPNDDLRVRNARATGNAVAEDIALWDARLPYRLSFVVKAEAKTTPEIESSGPAEKKKRKRNRIV